MEGDEIIAAHARAPGAIDVGDGAACKLERRIGGVVDVGLVRLVVLVPALGNMSCAEAGDALHLAEQVVEHVAPMAEHIEDDAAAVLLAVVPGRALRRLPVDIAHPLANTTARTARMRPKKPESIRVLSLSRPVRKSLSCTSPCLMPAFLAARATSTASLRVSAVGFSQ